jgi:hypothetical protein
MSDKFYSLKYFVEYVFLIRGNSGLKSDGARRIKFLKLN